MKRFTNSEATANQLLGRRNLTFYPSGPIVPTGVSPRTDVRPKRPDINMRIATASVPALLAVFSRTALASSCIELQGIESGGTEGVPEGVLDLDVLLKPETLGHPLAPINIFDNPLVGTVSEAGWVVV